MSRDGSARPTQVTSGDVPRLSEVIPVVDALAHVATIREQSGWRQLVVLIEEDLARPLVISDHNMLRNTLIEIVDTCRKTPNGLSALVKALTLLEPGSHSVQEVIRRLAEVSVHDVVPDFDRRTLQGLLAGVEPPDVLEAYLVAAAASVRGLGAHCSNAWDAYADLEEVNAGPDGIPPCLLFIECVAAQVDSKQAERLRTWNDTQVRRMELTHELLTVRQTLELRAVTDTATVAYLVIQLERYARDPGRYVLSHWKQLDPRGWYPRRGEDRVVSHAEIERQVEILVTEAEIEWAKFDGQIILEFVLPRELLNLPVEQWVTESETDHPTPLGVRYPIIIRSLERMRRKEWHRVWRQRWKHLRDGQRGAEAHWSEPVGEAYALRLEARLMTDLRVVSLILSAPPQPEMSSRVDEMLVALRAGVPVVIWHREDCSLPAFREHVERLLNGGLIDLPEQAKVLRLLGVEGLMQVPEHVAVMLDDPERLLEADGPPGLAS